MLFSISKYFNFSMQSRNLHLSSQFSVSNVPLLFDSSLNQILLLPIKLPINLIGLLLPIKLPIHGGRIIWKTFGVLLNIYFRFNFMKSSDVQFSNFKYWENSETSISFSVDF